MTTVNPTQFIGAANPSRLRLWTLPIVTALLIIIDVSWVGMSSLIVTVAASVAIVISGIPHGTLDAEIAAKYFGQNSVLGKVKIIAGYIACAAAMILFWAFAPELALVTFLVVSVIHFSRDWRGGADPFFAMMVGWALIALPALTHPQEVTVIFEILTGNQNGAAIAALLACASVPAALGSLVFSYWSFTNDDKRSAVEVVTCIVAALFLPPLIAFAVFFCGLHSPRHMAEALRETGAISSGKKAFIMAAVFGLSLGLGALLYISDAATRMDSGIVRAAFVLISTLTMPHFILEHLMSKRPQVARSDFCEPYEAG